MDVKTGFFYLFSLVLLFAAFRVITARNPVHAVLYLILAFSQASAIWLLLQAEFLAIVLVLVYLGAVLVLFLFVVMMLDVDVASLGRTLRRHFWFAMLFGLVIALEMAWILMGGFRATDESRNLAGAAAQAATQMSNTKALGILLYTEYLYPVQVAACILLVAMIAAIALTLRGRKDTRNVRPEDQVRVRAAERVALVKVDATRPAPPPPAPAAAEEKKA
ncbi:NADH-quinone oxidoreductase subunit J [Pseudorhodoferax sp. Leaf265]|uniref:NADH-quinone oxidoreductase subunit J n=1 Tax=Pseudorhodoferax sp. Leaf265 TaxID=1736315 RepID=UPI0006FB3BBE|nr:NADH-quinone oxidoreductase subunit J [Pseudorhodoferax sp. Leaf265]KQP19852.1 NADH:ubiquinone oxidoreductase subunit J [Pseudorhodoferax sp. Leaf265]